MVSSSCRFGLTALIVGVLMCVLPAHHARAQSKPKADRTALKVKAGKSAATVIWAPDATWFLVGGSEKFEKYSAAGKKLADIKLVKYAAGAPSIATYYGGHDSMSPDGTVVAFRASATAERGAQNTRLWTLDLSTSTITPISDGTGDAYWPSWSADSTTVFYTIKEGGKYQAFAFNRNDKSSRRLCDKVEDLKRIVALPDGHLVLVTASTVSLASATCDGSKAIGPKVENVAEIVLSPDAKRLAITNGFDGELWALDLAAGSTVKLATKAMLGAAWFDNDRVVFSRQTTENDWFPSELAFAVADGSKDGVVLQRSKGCSTGRVVGPRQGGVVAFGHHCKSKPDYAIGIVSTLPK